MGPSHTLSFPPLPTNDSMVCLCIQWVCAITAIICKQSTNSNVNHLNSPFAAENQQRVASIQKQCKVDDIDSSSDQDMDIALGTTIMPMIDCNTTTNNSQTTPTTATPTTKNSKKCPKKLVKKTRKHANKKKVESSLPVPALNKIEKKICVSPSTNTKIIKKSLNISNGKVHHRTPKRRPSKINKKVCKVSTGKNENSGKMEVAYSQQYPQVGFPFIYNSEGEHGKKFTCKFMDSSNGEGPAFCDRLFGQKCHWMRHCLEKHVPTEMSQRYQCRYCNMKYAQNSSLKEHVAICHSNKPPSFKCPYCAGQITFTRWTSVLRHCRNQHPNEEEPKKEMRERLKVNGTVKNTGNRKRGAKRRNVVRNASSDNHNHNHNQNNNNRRNGRNQMMPPMNIMPSVNMNISMNQMLSNIRNVAMMPSHNKWFCVWLLLKMLNVLFCFFVFGSR